MNILSKFIYSGIRLKQSVHLLCLKKGDRASYGSLDQTLYLFAALHKYNKFTENTFESLAC